MGVRQSPDCRHPLSRRRPRVFARLFRFFPEIDRASRRALGCQSGHLAPAPAAERWSPWCAWRASAARMRRDAVVSRRPASAPASPRVPRRRSPPSQFSSPAPPPSIFGPLALNHGSEELATLPRTPCGCLGLAALLKTSYNRSRLAAFTFPTYCPTRPILLLVLFSYSS
jgi:hypothetical protein